MKKVLAGLAAVIVVGAVVFLAMRTAPPAAVDSPAPASSAPSAPPAAKAEAAPPAKEDATPAPARRAAPAVKKANPAPVAPAAPAAPTMATLLLESDVPGASVFVNREYVGTTPLRLDKLDPGTRQLKLTADGHDGIERTVDLAPGENAVTMRFREVRLNTRIAVSHKHGMGGCEGTLVATVDGLSYQTDNKNDAFTLPFAQVETFVVDYLDKNLRVKQKGGRTWNFTDRTAANADALFVFHRDVEAARKKLDAGYTPVR